MPEEIRMDYEEARSIFSYSPRSAAALLRLVIKKLVTMLGDSGNNLDKSIRNLVKRGLRADIYKALISTRAAGSKAFPPGQLIEEDSLTTAHVLFALTNFIVEDMIVKPREVSELLKMLPVEGDGAVKQNNNTLS
jgi:hypothetical protein